MIVIKICKRLRAVQIIITIKRAESQFNLKYYGQFDSKTNEMKLLDVNKFNLKDGFVEFKAVEWTLLKLA